MRLSLIIVALSCLFHLTPSNAKTVQVPLIVSGITTYPDGVRKDNTLVFNGQYPGPLIQADLGDTLVVDVLNNLPGGQDTSVHWHGLFQNGSQFQDGPSWVTQCPLKNGQTQRYTIPLKQAGTYWYHSHYKSQYTDGMYGPLVIHNPNEPYQYDAELVVVLSDWYHTSWQQNEAWYLSTLSGGVPPFPNSGLMNGMGQFPCIVILDALSLKLSITPNCSDTQQFRSVYSVQPGKTYRVRVINMSAMSAFTFSIDGHKLQTIEVDGVDVDPANPSAPVDYAVLGTAQRYSFLLKTNQATTPKRFIMRSVMNTDFLALLGATPNLNQLVEQTLLSQSSAVLFYNPLQISATPVITIENNPYSLLGQGNPPVRQNPVYLNDMTLIPQTEAVAPSTFDREFVLSISLALYNGTVRTLFNNKPYLPPADLKPLLATYFQGGQIPSDSNPLVCNHREVVQIVLNNMEPIAHPVHLHGHTFWVVGKGDAYSGTYNMTSSPPLQMTTARRDTVLVPQTSWVVIRFVADNPGIWNLHCHIDWHNAGGMAQTVVEGQDYFMANGGGSIDSEARRVCGLQGLSI